MIRTQTYNTSGTKSFTFTTTAGGAGKIEFSATACTVFYIDNLNIGYSTQTTCITCHGGYRFGFNGMEKTDEWQGAGMEYTSEYRQYDPRLGRWMSLDPMMAQFPWQSPYVGMDNNPVALNDPNGDCTGPDCPDDQQNGSGGGNFPSDAAVGQLHTSSQLESSYSSTVNTQFIAFPPQEDVKQWSYIHMGNGDWRVAGWEMSSGEMYAWNNDEGWYTSDATGKQWRHPNLVMRTSAQVSNFVGGSVAPMAQMAIDGVTTGDILTSLRAAKESSGSSWGGFMWNNFSTGVSNLFTGGATGAEAWGSLWTGGMVGGPFTWNATGTLLNGTFKSVTFVMGMNPIGGNIGKYMFKSSYFGYKSINYGNTVWMGAGKYGLLNSPANYLRTGWSGHSGNYVLRTSFGTKIHFDWFKVSNTWGNNFILGQ